MASREMLEWQMAYYSERIRVINTQLNLLAPISKLPPSLLSNIFLGAVGAESADNDSADGDEECPNEGGRNHISHVCRHWREVALQCAELWSDLSVPDTPEMVQGFLARSREAPLSITVNLEQLDYFNMHESCRDDTLLGLSALHRVRSLTVLLYKSQRYDPTNAVLERLRGCTPLLESLKIASPSERSNPARLRSAISGILLHPETRPLRSLTTQICYIDTPFHALVHLDIRTRGSIKEAGVESFLQALDRMPCLEELTLCEMFSYRIDDCTWDIPEGSQSLITVPRLRRLKIAYKGQPFTGMMLLNRLHAPSLRHLYLDQQGEGLPRDSGLLLAAVSQKAATLGPFSTLSYGPDGTVHAYRKAFQCTADPRDDSTSEWLQQHAAALRVSSGRQFMSELMPLGDVRTLILDGGLPIRDQWLALTRGMEAVTELRWHDSDYDEDELGGMLSLRHGGLGDGHTPYVLPNLDVVTMDTLVFCSPEEPRSIRALANCFAQRALDVAEIKTIRILSAQQICRMDYDNIREAVPYVEMDGRL